MKVLSVMAVPLVAGNFIHLTGAEIMKVRVTRSGEPSQNPSASPVLIGKYASRSS